MITFSVMATPIGNLEDITLRALNVLRKADLVLCEDTRMTKRLLDRYDIHVETKSYHAHSISSKVEEIITLIGAYCKSDDRGSHIHGKDLGVGRDLVGSMKNIVLVSDAGTPAISDPGSELVGRIRREFDTEIAAGTLKIQAIPGPSALTAALSIAGVPCSEFIFLGFLPHKKGRQTIFREILSSERTVVFYESPHRIMKTLQMLKQCNVVGQNPTGRPQKVTICRELTKIFEEVTSGTAGEVEEYFSTNRDKVRGEFVVIVSGSIQ